MQSTFNPAVPLERSNSTQFAVDGIDESGNFAGDGQNPPFVIFHIQAQINFAGPYASRSDAMNALNDYLEGYEVSLDKQLVSECLVAIDNGKNLPPIASYSPRHRMV